MLPAEEGLDISKGGNRLEMPDNIFSILVQKIQVIFVIIKLVVIMIVIMMTYGTLHKRRIRYQR